MTIDDHHHDNDDNRRRRPVLVNEGHINLWMHVDLYVGDQWNSWELIIETA